jgi:hypothetical protein
MNENDCTVSSRLSIVILSKGLRILRRPRLGPVSTHCKFRYFGEPLRQFLHYRDRNSREFRHHAHKRFLWDSQCDKTIFGTDRRRARRVAVLSASGDSDLLDVDELGVPRTAIAHPGGVGFGRFAPTEGEGAPLVRCPGAVIVTDDGLGLAVAESDLVDSHGGASFSRAPPSPAALLVRQGNGGASSNSGRKEERSVAAQECELSD